jgi:hypothetical protein
MTQQTTVEEPEIVIRRDANVLRVTITFPGEAKAKHHFEGFHRARQDGSLFRLIEEKAHGER